MMRTRFILAGLIGLAATLHARAHAAHAVVETQAIGVQFIYDDGSPMANAEVSILAPGMEQTFWTIPADPHGRIAFVPDRPGTWVITANDGLGHGLTRRVEVGADGVAVPHDHAGSRVNGIVAGAGVIFGLFGLAAWWSSRRGSPGRGPS